MCSTEVAFCNPEWVSMKSIIASALKADETRECGLNKNDFRIKFLRLNSELTGC